MRKRREEETADERAGSRGRMIWAFLQARTQSTRLPGKIRLPIGGLPMVERVIRRARQIPGVGALVVLTSDATSDEWLAEACSERVFRGAEEDVLARFQEAAEMFCETHDWIVRVTGDCPALDPVVSGQVVRLAVENRVDYASNTRDWPDGLDTEVFTVKALRETSYFATGEADREHVTPWMKRNLFCLELPLVPPQRYRKWSVDTEEELEYVRELYQALGPNFKWRDVAQADAGRLCEWCARGEPHVWRDSADGKRTMWDLHQVEAAGGRGFQECRAWQIRKQAAEQGGA